MKTSNELCTLLHSIDHKGYPNYKQTKGGYRYGGFDLYIDHVQGDPFAAPSALHIEVPHKKAGFPQEYYSCKTARVSLQDHLTRLISDCFERYNYKAKGSGKSGLIAITHCGQEVLERSACQITEDGITVRFFVGFPAFGRTINSSELEKILFEFLPRCVQNSLYYDNIDKKAVRDAIYLAEDQEELRHLIKEKKLVAFVANGSVLPRKSGVSDKPLLDSVVFESPSELEYTFTLGHRGEVTGMGIPEGITLIVGGGYHGKSTLLSAIQQGVYNHIAGDGREMVVTDATAVKLRAEDGRSIRNVDITMFIRDLPNGKDTKKFSTEDASGSTSQAAGVIEGMEAGAGLFLIDEDTSATNFMVRDELMQTVIARDKEPITPFLERARDMYETSGISTILVAGSSGAFFYIADNILQMDNYRAVDITEKVKKLCGTKPAPRIRASGYAAPEYNRVLPKHIKTAAKRERVQDNRSPEGRRHEHMKVKAYGKESFSLDKSSVNVRYIEQLADSEQTLTLAYLLRDIIEKRLDGKKTVQDIVRETMKQLDGEGFSMLSDGYIPCGMAMPRIQELYACLNRYRG